MNNSNFDWGWMNEDSELAILHKRGITQEIFVDKIYEKINKVKQGDVVLDIGASIGPFTHSILHKNPAKVVCIEPSKIELPTLEKNIKQSNVIIVEKGIGDIDGVVVTDQVFGVNGLELEIPCIKFKTLVENLNLEKIDFLKTDCEGGEYFIFNLENLFWIKDNVNFAVGEWHLSSSELKQKFREFRDLYLKLFPDHSAYSLDGVDIKWDLWNDHFIEYYTEVIIHININKNN